MTQPVGAVPTAPVGYVGSATSPSATSGTASGATQRNDELGQDAFLQLLVAQLRYQDPSNPVDSSQFMAQTAQFTSVEKLTELATTQTTMLGAQAFLQAAAVLGRTITWTNPDGTEVSGVATAAQFGSAGPQLVVGGTHVPISAVTRLDAGPAITPEPESSSDPSAAAAASDLVAVKE